MGVPWPDPRFTDNGNGTVTDNLTGLIWLKDAKCFQGQGWCDALIASNNLAHGQCGLSDGSSPGDWRLPNISELLSLINYGAVALYTCQDRLPKGHPFGDHYNAYWTSTLGGAYAEDYISY